MYNGSLDFLIWTTENAIHCKSVAKVKCSECMMAIYYTCNGIKRVIKCCYKYDIVQNHDQDWALIFFGKQEKVKVIEKKSLKKISISFDVYN